MVLSDDSEDAVEREREREGERQRINFVKHCNDVYTHTHTGSFI